MFMIVRHYQLSGFHFVPIIIMKTGQMLFDREDSERIYR